MYFRLEDYLRAQGMAERDEMLYNMLFEGTLMEQTEPQDSTSQSPSVIEIPISPNTRALFLAEIPPCYTPWNAEMVKKKREDIKHNPPVPTIWERRLSSDKNPPHSLTIHSD